MLPKTHNGILYFHSQLLETASGRRIIHGFTCKSGDALESLDKLIERVQSAWKLKKLFTVKQVHGNDVAVVGDKKDNPDEYHKVEADAIISKTPNIAVAVRTADCVPILIVAPNQAVCAVHGGWRGIIGGVIEKAMMKLKDEIGVKPQEIFSAIGPHIGACCYEVGEDVACQFEKRFGKEVAKSSNSGKKMLDLALSAKIALVRAGVEPTNIDVLRICTKCNPQWFYSFRRDGKPCGRQLSFIALGS